MKKIIIKIIKFIQSFKKKKVEERVDEFLTRKFTPLAKYVFNAKVFACEVPVLYVESNELIYDVYIIGERSERLAHFKVSVDNVIEWMK